MRYITTLFLLTLSFLITTSSSVDALETLSPKVSASIDQQLAINKNRYGVVGQSVLILKNHLPVYRGQHGSANIELGVDINETHIFPSYSITKLFTSVLVMQQVEQGSLELDSSILAYLPYLPKQWEPVTIEHLLNHTSGIPLYFGKTMDAGSFLSTKKAVFLSLINEPQHFKIGTKNSYKNTGFLLLSAILEQSTGKSYQELVKEVIVSPLKLKNTGHTSAKDIIKNQVTSYRGADGQVRKNVNIDWPEYTFSHSALYSTPDDLASFMSALVKGKFVSKKTLKDFWQPMKLADGEDGRYAFGFEYSNEDRYSRVGHDGGNHVKLRYYFNPKDSNDNFTLVYATNGNAYDVWTDVLADSVMAIIAPEKFKMAALNERFLTNFLENDIDGLQQTYKILSKAFNNEDKLVESYLINRAYALRYGAGPESSLPAFKFTIGKFPNSNRAQHGLIEAQKASKRSTL
jgi:CubicO group peptidase (beta-lactamase class C family)